MEVGSLGAQPRAVAIRPHSEHTGSSCYRLRFAAC